MGSLRIWDVNDTHTLKVRQKLKDAPPLRQLMNREEAEYRQVNQRQYELHGLKWALNGIFKSGRLARATST